MSEWSFDVFNHVTTVLIVTFSVAHNETHSMLWPIVSDDHACSLFVVWLLEGWWLGSLMNWKWLYLLPCLLLKFALLVLTWDHFNFAALSFSFSCEWLFGWKRSVKLCVHCRWLAWNNFLLLRRIEINDCKLAVFILYRFSLSTVSIVSFEKEWGIVAWVWNTVDVLLAERMHLWIHVALEIRITTRHCRLADDLRLIEALLVHKWASDAEWNVRRDQICLRSWLSGMHSSTRSWMCWLLVLFWSLNWGVILICPAKVIQIWLWVVPCTPAFLLRCLLILQVDLVGLFSSVQNGASLHDCWTCRVRWLGALLLTRVLLLYLNLWLHFLSLDCLLLLLACHHVFDGLVSCWLHATGLFILFLLLTSRWNNYALLFNLRSVLKAGNFLCSCYALWTLCHRSSSFDLLSCFDLLLDRCIRNDPSRVGHCQIDVWALRPTTLRLSHQLILLFTFCIQTLILFGIGHFWARTLMTGVFFFSGLVVTCHWSSNIGTGRKIHVMLLLKFWIVLPGRVTSISKWNHFVRVVLICFDVIRVVVLKHLICRWVKRHASVDAFTFF